MEQNVIISQEDYNALVSERDEYRDIALCLKKELETMIIKGGA